MQNGWASNAAKTSPIQRVLQTLWVGKGNPAAKPPDHIIFGNNFLIAKKIVTKNYVVRPSFPLVFTYSPRLLRRRVQKGFLSGILPTHSTVLFHLICQLPDKLVFFEWGRRQFWIICRYSALLS